MQHINQLKFKQCARLQLTTSCFGRTNVRRKTKRLCVVIDAILFSIKNKRFTVC